MGKFNGKIVLLDAGHGGIIGSKYQTPGKRSYFKDKNLMDVKKLGVEHCEEHCDTKYYEGVGNRLIRDELGKMLADAGIAYVYVTTGGADYGLSDRAKVVNNYAKKFGTGNCLVVSIHSDAFSKESAHGWSVFTSKGETGSDAVAEECFEQAKKKWPKETFRKDTTDGDHDKEADFTILVKTNPRAILVENFFMTNYKDYSTHLATAEGQKEIAEVLFETIKATL